MADETQPFTYEGDVQPLMSNYFNAVNRSGLGVGLLQTERNRLEANSARDLELKQRAQQFEVTRLQLEDARRKSTSSLGMNEAVSALGQQLSMGLSLPEQDRKLFTSKIGISFAPIIAGNEIAKGMYKAAQDANTGTSRSNTDDKYITDMMGNLNKVKMGEDMMKRPTDAYKDEVSAGYVGDIITVFGTPEDQQASDLASPLEQFKIARGIRNKYMMSKNKGAVPTAVQSPRTLFSKKPDYSTP